MGSHVSLLKCKSIVLLVDNLDDEEIAILALRKADVNCDVVVPRSADEANKYFNSLDGRRVQPQDLVVIDKAPWSCEAWMRFATVHDDHSDSHRSAHRIVFHPFHDLHFPTFVHAVASRGEVI